MSERLESYLDRLERALAPLTAPERTEIVQETRSHVLDRLESRPGAGAEDVLLELGPPDAYAARFLEADPDASRGAGAGERLSRLTTRGWRGLLAFNGVVILYGMGLFFLALATLKALRPERVGLWFDSAEGLWTLAFFGTEAPPGREVLGWWLLAVALGFALIALCGATALLRRVTR